MTMMKNRGFEMMLPQTKDKPKTITKEVLFQSIRFRIFKRIYTLSFKFSYTEE